MSLHIDTKVTTPSVHYRMTSNQANISRWTMMIWASFIDIGTTYVDLFALRSWSPAATNPTGTGDGNIIGLTLFNALADGKMKLNIGDTATDSPDTRQILPNEWHHYTFTSQPDPAGSGNVTLTAYFDGFPRLVDITKLGPNLLGTTYGYVLFNSRESDTDWGSVWNGDLCAFKMWNDVVLTAAEIQNEMWSVVPKRRAGLYSWLPMIQQPRSEESVDGIVGQAWTVRTSGGALSTGKDPIGVAWNQEFTDPYYHAAPSLGSWGTVPQVFNRQKISMQQRYA